MKIVFKILCILLLIVVSIKVTYAANIDWQNYYGTLVPDSKVNFKCTYDVSISNLSKIVIEASTNGIYITHISINGSPSKKNIVEEFSYNTNPWASISITYPSNAPLILYTVGTGVAFDFAQFLNDVLTECECPEMVGLMDNSGVLSFAYPVVNPKYKLTINHNESYLRDGKSGSTSCECIEGECYNEGGEYIEPNPDPDIPDDSFDITTKTESLPYTLNELNNNGYLFKDYSYGNLHGCILQHSSDASLNALQDLGPVKFKLSDGQELQACVERIETSQSNYANTSFDYYDEYVKSAYSKWHYTAQCANGYKAYDFNKVIVDDKTSSKKVYIYMGSVCAYVNYDNGEADFISLKNRMETILNNFEFGSESGDCNGCENILKNRSTILSEYQTLKRDLTELYDNYDFSEIDEMASKIEKLSCDDYVKKCENREFIKPDSIEINPQDCKSLLGDPDENGTPAYYLSFAFKVIKYIAIIILIVFSIMDFITAVSAQDNDALKKAMNKALIRFVLCVIIFLLPVLIKFILKYINDKAVDLCIKT